MAREANDGPPELSHLATVTTSNKLPTFRARICGSSIYYLGVEKINSLNDFRALVPGTRILFPPLLGSTP